MLLAAVVTMAADLSTDELLGRIVRIAADLSGARYAALGVLDEVNTGQLRLFITHGLDEAAAEAIGPLPTGHGILGVIIDRPQPLRLHDIAEHPASYGFPAHHPPMTSFLGVPVRTRDTVFGNLYLTEKLDGQDFTEQDEQIVLALAAAAGVAIENAHLHEESRRREAWLTATAEISAVLTRAQAPTDALRAITDRARQLAGADVAWIVAGDPDQLALEAVSGAAADPALIAKLDLRNSLARAVSLSGEPVRIDNFRHDPRVVDLATQLGWPPLGPGLMVPLRTRSGTVGVLAIGWSSSNQQAFSELDPVLPRLFAEQTALALELARSHRDKRRIATFEDRDRIARDLHDVVIQKLFALGLSLQTGVRTDLSASGRALVDKVIDELDAAIREIRATIFELSVTERSGGDVQSEVIRLVERATTSLRFRPNLQLNGPLRSAVTPALAADLLTVLAELLSNCARHAHATRVDVDITVTASEVRLTVSDNGIGLPDDAHHSGLASMRARAEPWSGVCEVSTAPSHGTTVTWTAHV